MRDKIKRQYKNGEIEKEKKEWILNLIDKIKRK
jgi:hypothetical protein